MTYYTVFVMDLASRRVHVLGSTPHPGDVCMGQIVRLVTAADDGVLNGHRVLICDRDRGAVRQRCGDGRHPRGPDTGTRPERECALNVDAIVNTTGELKDAVYTALDNAVGATIRR